MENEAPYGKPKRKYKVGDKFDFDGIIEILATCGYNPVKQECMYQVRMPDGRIVEVEESWIDGGIKHFDLDENGCVKGKDYVVSYIASAPEELKIGDRVEVVDAADNLYRKQGFVQTVPVDGRVMVEFANNVSYSVRIEKLRKLPDTILFEEDSDNMKTFKAILDEMVETYRAKDADYGSAYDDGYRLFGHTQLLSRIYEKFSRVKHLLDGNKPNVAENIYDTLTDMAVQAICLRMLLQKNDFENVD